MKRSLFFVFFVSNKHILNYVLEVWDAENYKSDSSAIVQRALNVCGTINNIEFCTSYGSSVCVT